ncbi:Methionine synthase, vitamin-B12 independent, putative [Cordyceps militaris CM01]|uniref:Methionine synthase, vitamin-B12 independent, putative n=1 Tax=Cordyceps militaris (strain CM01) TaxID=983644 RepID=G3JJ17_CORMM|nr:Methionine synthase, vitamin-B12 independent, putative [Cordyceps militaris CM01]EGX91164.1 Methionine synthase, vitamin-B12 independent, putative [Cordyceps militaris CM01]
MLATSAFPNILEAGNMGNTKLPFHADHIGSLIRPVSLSQAQKKADEGSISVADLQVVQRAAIADIVQKQLANGVRAISSGEYDRKYYFSGFFEKLAGFREVSPVPWELARVSAPPIAALKQAGQQYPMAAVCDGKIRRLESPYMDSWKMLRDTLPREKWGACKFTMPPPCYFHLRLAKGKCYSPEAYSNDGDFFADLAVAYQQEIQALYDEGLRNLQIDDPTLAYFCSDEMLAALEAEGEDPEALFTQYLQAHNDCIARRPADMHIGLHICRGNFAKSMHFSQGSYERIAARFFSTLDYDTFFLEYDDARSGGFEPLRHLPREKNVVLGVVTTKDPTLEDRDQVKQRVVEAARIVAAGQGVSLEEAMSHIGISPQCGFSSMAVGGADGMTEVKMFEKLKLVQDIARELWP